MPISGLVITLTGGAARGGVAAALARHAAISVGEPSGHRLPIVVETAGDDEDRRIWDWLHTLPGVAMVDVAMINFDGGDAGERAAGEESNTDTTVTEGRQA